MARLKGKDIFFFIFLLLLQCFTQFAVSGSVVKVLPGFEGPLPFHLETGYIGVGESELFYYFVKSERNASEDPLLLWLTGGPGCTSFSGLVIEIGPIKFKIVEYNGSLPTLVLNPNSWTKVSSIIFLDLPVGVGFSYPRNPIDYNTSSDTIQVHQADQFLRKWLKDHPKFLANEVYVGGDSYSGKTVPAIVQHLSNNGNENGVKPPVNIKGYVLGNPATDANFDDSARIPYAHGMGLISDELYESLKRNCGGENLRIDSSNAECLKYKQDFDKVNTAHILAPLCGYKTRHLNGKRRSLGDNYGEFLYSDPYHPAVNCPEYVTVLLTPWANNGDVQKALNIRKGSIKKWKRCNWDIDYTYDITSSIEYHLNLGKKGYRALVYSGDHDMIMPFLGTRAWIRYLNYSIVDDWRPWFLGDEVAGYTRSYSNLMTYATIKGGGHTAEYRPLETYAMFERWIQKKPL